MPLLVHEAAARRPLRRWHGSSPRTSAASSTRRSRLPMFWVTICNEGWARFDVAATGRREPRELPGARRRGSRASLPARPARRCLAMPRPRATGRPWSSAVPVLLLAGDDDPQDPPANLAGWRKTFPSGRLDQRARPGARRHRLRLPAPGHSAFRRCRNGSRPGRELRAPRAAAALRAQVAECAARAGRASAPRVPGRAGMPSAAIAPRTPPAAATKSAARTPSTTVSGEL